MALDLLDVRAVNPGVLAVVSVTGASSNAGKTWICESILRGCARDGMRTLALKVTRTHTGVCPRGHDACGTCESLAGTHRVVRERELLDIRGKDTGRYFAAGAHGVLWLLVHPSAVREALAGVVAEIPPGTILVAEGNSFRNHAHADVTLMAWSPRFPVKQSALSIVDRVDGFVARPEGAGNPPTLARMTPFPTAQPVTPEKAWEFVRTRLAHAVPADLRS